MPTITLLVWADLLKGGASYENGKQTVKRVAFVQFDTQPVDYDEAEALFRAEAEVEIGDAFKDSDSRVLKKITPGSLGTTTDFVFDLEYETPSTETSQTNPNPLMRPDEISGGGTSSQQPYAKDYDTTPKPVTTPAGEPYATLPQNWVGEHDIVIKCNRATLDVATWPTYMKPACATNSGSVTIRDITFPAGTLLFKTWRFSSRYENDVSFFEVEFSIGIADTWQQTIENRGFSSLVSGKPMPIMQADGKTRVSAPYPLNEDGTKMSTPTATPSTTTFKAQPPKDFSVFAWTST